MRLESTDDNRAATRWGIYIVLIALGLGGITGRILAVNSVNVLDLEKYLRDKEKRPNWQLARPFLSANDRSRWCTMRALVEHGTYAIDDIVTERGWDTIDMVKHDGHGNPAPKADEGHLYSSKPPLLATLYAGPYWLVYQITGATLGTHPYAIGRGLLILFNVLPLLVYFVVIARLAERYATTDWARVFIVATAVFATFLTTFATVINNHLPAAVCAAIALDMTLRVAIDGERQGWRFALAGLCAALTVTCELPALAFAVVIVGALLMVAPRATLLGFLPPALLVTVAYFGTSYAAHETLLPAYSQRHTAGGWYDFEYLRDGKVRDSYFSARGARSPIDQGEPGVATYAFHSLIGHHGIFSLTPIWLLSFAGMGLMCCDRTRLRNVGIAVAFVSLVCIVFFLFRPLEDRNYGGTTSGFRWVFWLAPLWLLALAPVLDRFANSRAVQIFAGFLLGISALSVSYPTWNPWVHPWLLDYLLHLQAVHLGTG